MINPTIGGGIHKVLNYIEDNIERLKGPKGDKGDKGEQGIQGPKGDIGPQGIKGDTGNAGVTGVKGNSETSYRTNNVNLTPANIGAFPITGGHMTGSNPFIGFQNNSLIGSFTKSNSYKNANQFAIAPSGWSTNDDLNSIIYIGGYTDASGYCAISCRTDNVYYLGFSSSRFKSIYAVTGTIQTSDRNYKEDISDFDDDFIKLFIMGIKPVSFKLKDADTGRTHYGMIAQDIEQLMQDIGITSMDFAGFIKSPKEKTTDIFEEYEEEEIDSGTGETKVVQKKRLIGTETEEIPGEYIYSLRYDEFIAPLIRMVQLQQEQINELKSRLDAHLQEEQK